MATTKKRKPRNKKDSLKTVPNVNIVITTNGKRDVYSLGEVLTKIMQAVSDLQTNHTYTYEIKT